MSDEQVQNRAEQSDDRDRSKSAGEKSAGSKPEINDLEADNEVEQDMIETVDPDNAPA